MPWRPGCFVKRLEVVMIIWFYKVLVTRMYMCVHVYACRHVCMCIHLCMFVSLFLCIDVSMYVMLVTNQVNIGRDKIDSEMMPNTSSKKCYFQRIIWLDTQKLFDSMGVCLVSLAHLVYCNTSEVHAGKYQHGSPRPTAAKDLPEEWRQKRPKWFLVS